MGKINRINEAKNSFKRQKEKSQMNGKFNGINIADVNKFYSRRYQIS
jgi:hypothetical protein